MTLKHWELMPGQAVTLRRVTRSIFDARATFICRDTRFACFEQEQEGDRVWLALLPSGELCDAEYHVWEIRGEKLTGWCHHTESERPDVRLGLWHDDAPEARDETL